MNYEQRLNIITCSFVFDSENKVYDLTLFCTSKLAGYTSFKVFFVVYVATNLSVTKAGKHVCRHQKYREQWKHIHASLIFRCARDFSVPFWLVCKICCCLIVCCIIIFKLIFLAAFFFFFTYVSPPLPFVHQPSSMLHRLSLFFLSVPFCIAAFLVLCFKRSYICY